MNEDFTNLLRNELDQILTIIAADPETPYFGLAEKVKEWRNAMTLQGIEQEIRRKIPAAGVISVTHQITTNEVGEIWNAMAYAKDAGPGQAGIVICNSDHLCKTPEDCVASAVKDYNIKNTPADKEKRIADLEKAIKSLKEGE